MNKNLKKLVYSAVCIALGIVTGMLTIYQLPNGGGITLCSTFFLALPGLLFGPYWGMTAGAAAGILNFILNPYFLSPIQWLLDYPLAFAALGLSGFFSHKKNGLYFGYIAGCIGRFVFAFLSGVIFYADYAPEGMNPAVYSAGYNLSYIAVECGITLVILLIPAVHKAYERIRTQALS